MLLTGDAGEGFPVVGATQLNVSVWPYTIRDLEGLQDHTATASG